MTDAISTPALAQILHKHQVKSKVPIQYMLSLLQCTLDPQITRKSLWTLLLRQEGSHWLVRNFPSSPLGQIWASDPEDRGVTSCGLLAAHPVLSLCFIKLIYLNPLWANTVQDEPIPERWSSLSTKWTSTEPYPPEPPMEKHMKAALVKQMWNTAWLQTSLRVLPPFLLLSP